MEVEGDVGAGGVAEDAPALRILASLRRLSMSPGFVTVPVPGSLRLSCASLSVLADGMSESSSGRI